MADDAIEARASDSLLAAAPPLPPTPITGARVLSVQLFLLGGGDEAHL